MTPGSSVFPELVIDRFNLVRVGVPPACGGEMTLRIPAVNFKSGENSPCGKTRTIHRSSFAWSGLASVRCSGF